MAKLNPRSRKRLLTVGAVVALGIGSVAPAIAMSVSSGDSQVSGDEAAVPGNTATLLNESQVLLAAAAKKGPEWPMLQVNTSGTDVTTMQHLLRHHGKKDLEVDGEFGPLTRKAVLAFQRTKKIEVDGIVGPQTWSKLIVKLDKGAKGSQVKAFQRQLRRLGYKIPKYGEYEAKTAQAVAHFKKRYKLGTGTAIDATTWRYALGASVPVGPVRDRILSVAKSQVGVGEPNGCAKYWWYGSVPAPCADDVSGPWCAGFLGWVWNQAKSPNNLKSYYVPTWSNWAKRTGLWTSKPTPGDAVVFGGRHIGIVYKVYSSRDIVTIEGNTGPAPHSKVMKKRFSPSSRGVTGYIKPVK